MNQIDQMNQTTPAPFIHTLNTTARPDPIYSNNAEFNDIEDIIYILYDKLLRNLNKYRQQQIKSNLYLYLYYYNQIKRTEKKRKIFNYVLQNIFNSLESLITDNNKYISNNNIYNDFTEEEKRDTNNIVHYKFNFLHDEIKNIFKYKLIEEFLNIPDFKDFEANIRHFSEPLGGHYIKYYNNGYINTEYQGRINCYIFNYENTINLNNIYNNSILEGDFIYLLNFNLFNNILFNDNHQEQEEEEEEEPEGAEGFDFFELSYYNSPPLEDESEERQKEKIGELKKDYNILINKTNLFYYKKTNYYIYFYKILQIKENPEDPPACCLCLETNNNIYRFQAVGGCCSCPAFFCLDCILYWTYKNNNNHKNNKNNIMEFFKCLICKNIIKPYGRLEANKNHFILCGYYEEIKKQLIYKMPYLINIIRSIKDKNKNIRYIKDIIKYHSLYNIYDFSELLYKDIIKHINILNEFNKKIQIKPIISISILDNGGLLTKKNLINKRKIKNIDNYTINKLVFYYNLELINRYKLITDKKDILNYQILKQEQKKRQIKKKIIKYINK